MHVAAIPRPTIPMPAVRIGWLLGVAATWWLVGSSRLDQMPAAGDHAIRAALPLALAGLRLTGSACETLFYFLWWRSSGQRFSFVSALPWFATLTLADAWAGTLRSIANDVAEPWVSVLAVFAGVGVHFEPSEALVPGLAAAFGDVGLLALARILGTAAIQARETGRRLRRPLVLTVIVWLIVKLIAWWSFDLMRGMSPA